MEKRKNTLLLLQFGLPKKILISAVIMLALIALVYFLHIPNPNMILIAGLVLCSALFGYGGGIVAAVIMLFYTLFFFSTDHSFFQFTDENLRKVGVSLVGIAADMLFVCALKQAEVQAFREVDELTEKLRQENEHLQRISLTDALTGLCNRLALRQDYPSYCHHEVTVMMLDLDRFKAINDTYGHDTGDQLLKVTARLLADTFGWQYCYRYGGDEFLMIVPDLSEEVFREKLDHMLQVSPEVDIGGTKIRGEYSVGLVHDLVDDDDKLRSLFSIADERMYQYKRRQAAAIDDT